jgi:mannitol-1-/sugar-/sorbitol-6-phosphatase
VLWDQCVRARRPKGGRESLAGAPDSKVLPGRPSHAEILLPVDASHFTLLHLIADNGFDQTGHIRYRFAMNTSALPTRPFAAFLFDMDGTILNSIEAAERAWTAWARKHGLDVAAFLPTIHGVRGIETISRLQLPGVDPSAEVREVLLAEMEDMDGVRAIAGAAEFLASLPEDRWAIVTSSPRELAIRRLDATGLPHPRILVTGEDVENGKPAPDCFLLAAQRLRLPIEDCLVFEDAPAGIQAAEAAGASVVVVAAAHARPMETAHLSILGYDALVARLLTECGLRLGLAAGA